MFNAGCRVHKKRRQISYSLTLKNVWGWGHLKGAVQAQSTLPQTHLINMPNAHTISIEIRFFGGVTLYFL